MNLTTMTINEFTDILASDAPAPGGGAAAALLGATGIALTSMVASLTIGRKKYADNEAFAKELIEKSARIKADFLTAMEEDALTFNQVAAVFSMAKDTEEEKSARKNAMEKALKGCTIPPYKMMELSLESLQLTKTAIGNTNTTAASDIGVAALALKAAIQSGWLNVVININSIKDEEFASDYRNKGEALLSKALPLADEIYETILKSL